MVRSSMFGFAPQVSRTMATARHVKVHRGRLQGAVIDGSSVVTAQHSWETGWFVQNIHTDVTSQRLAGHGAIVHRDSRMP